MKKLIYSTLALLAISSFSCSSGEGDEHLERPSQPETKKEQNNNTPQTKKEQGFDAEFTQHINTEQFKQLVFDFTAESQWNFKGNKPCIIDFYADWCKPCKIVAPTLEQIAKEYDGKLNVYKINTDQNRELANAFQISSIPTILFCPVDGQPQATMGVMDKAEFDKIIADFFKL